MLFLAPQYTFAIYDSVSSNLSNIVLEVDMSGQMSRESRVVVGWLGLYLEGLDWMRKKWAGWNLHPLEKDMELFNLQFPHWIPFENNTLQSSYGTCRISNGSNPLNLLWLKIWHDLKGQLGSHKPQFIRKGLIGAYVPKRNIFLLRVYNSIAHIDCLSGNIFGI